MSRAPEARASALASLGLGPEARTDEVRKAYRRLALRYHPDGSGDPKTAGRFAGVLRAYKVLVAAEGSGPGSAARRFRCVEEARGDLFALGQVLASDADPGARRAAARALGLSGRYAAYVFLRRALYDTAAEVALEAVRAAALLGARQAEGEIAALYSRSSPELRREILEVAAATQERLFRSTLEVAVRDTESELRVLARKARQRSS